MILQEELPTGVVPLPQNPLATASAPATSSTSSAYAPVSSTVTHPIASAPPSIRSPSSPAASSASSPLVQLSEALASPISLTPYSPFIFGNNVSPSPFSPATYAEMDRGSTIPGLRVARYVSLPGASESVPTSCSPASSSSSKRTLSRTSVDGTWRDATAALEISVVEERSLSENEASLANKLTSQGSVMLDSLPRSSSLTNIHSFKKIKGHEDDRFYEAGMMHGNRSVVSSGRKIPFEVIKLKGIFPNAPDKTFTCQTDHTPYGYLQKRSRAGRHDAASNEGLQVLLAEMPVVKELSYYEKMLATCKSLEDFVSKPVYVPKEDDAHDDADHDRTRATSVQDAKEGSVARSVCSFSYQYQDKPLSSLLPLCDASFPDKRCVSRCLLRENKTSPQPYLTHFHPGASFSGYQRSGQNNYLVLVTFQHIDLSRSHLCGYLQIKGLTKEYPELTTFFEAEIIGPHYHFITYKWDATPAVDYEHWTKFSGFFKSEQILKEYDKSPINLNASNFLFMRWKEHFLVPDHHIRQINGASYEGFYYICMNLKEGEISGYYYHSQSEQFQELCLKYVEERCSESYEFH